MATSPILVCVEGCHTPKGGIREQEPALVALTNTIEKVARAIAGFYGPNFDECLPTRQVVKHEAVHGRANINDNDQELHHYAARAALAAILEDMAEPSEDILGAGLWAATPHDTGDEDAMKDAWQAMLSEFKREALNDE